VPCPELSCSIFWVPLGGISASRALSYILVATFATTTVLLCAAVFAVTGSASYGSKRCSERENHYKQSASHDPSSFRSVGIFPTAQVLLSGKEATKVPPGQRQGLCGEQLSSRQPGSP
jgi:hypothetical protein